MGGKQKQLVQVCKRRRLASCSKRRKIKVRTGRYARGGIKGESREGNS